MHVSRVEGSQGRPLWEGNKLKSFVTLLLALFLRTSKMWTLPDSALYTHHLLETQQGQIPQEFFLSQHFHFVLFNNSVKLSLCATSYFSTGDAPLMWTVVLHKNKNFLLRWFGYLLILSCKKSIPTFLCVFFCMFTKLYKSNKMPIKTWQPKFSLVSVKC